MRLSSSFDSTSHFLDFKPYSSHLAFYSGRERGGDLAQAESNVEHCWHCWHCCSDDLDNNFLSLATLDQVESNVMWDSLVSHEENRQNVERSWPLSGHSNHHQNVWGEIRRREEQRGASALTSDNGVDTCKYQISSITTFVTMLDKYLLKLLKHSVTLC